MQKSFWRSFLSPFWIHISIVFENFSGFSILYTLIVVQNVVSWKLPKKGQIFLFREGGVKKGAKISYLFISLFGEGGKGSK